MSHDLITVTPDTKLSHAMEKMLSKRINCLPVVDDANNLCGIITSTDFLENVPLNARISGKTRQISKVAIICFDSTSLSKV
jgi:CBS-domain-containing membrane protein